MIRSGEIVRQFVKDVGDNKEKILAADNLVFINFPLSPINSHDAVFVDFLLHEPLHYSDGLFNYKKEYSYSILTYSTLQDKGNLEIQWKDNNNFILSGMIAKHTFVIPAQISTELEEQVEEIYNINKPHAQLQQFDSSNSRRELKNAILEVQKWNKFNNQLDLSVKLNQQFVQNAGYTLFFLYNQGRFRLANEIDFKKYSKI